MLCVAWFFAVVVVDIVASTVTNWALSQQAAVAAEAQYVPVNLIARRTHAVITH